MRPPGFEPGLQAWKAWIITRLDYGRSRRESIVSGCDLRVLIKWTQLAGQWKAGIILGVGLITPACFEQVSGRLLSYLDGAPPFPVCTYRSVEGFDPDGRNPLASGFDGSVEGCDSETEQDEYRKYN